ncbi:hypothetical protein TNCT_473121 [Trichonephila clavata]|uniref:Uncharacterized protein n=1 Tax=Trichonephila clavata TaxID=2740835 RepID=A0A8X6G1S7_TRICU|nr:hypothetical protein TNCT_473121 [Trichonephila clavata]
MKRLSCPQRRILIYDEPLPHALIPKPIIHTQKSEKDNSSRDGFEIQHTFVGDELTVLKQWTLENLAHPSPRVQRVRDIIPPHLAQQALA